MRPPAREPASRAPILVVLAAALHVFFLVLEMFLWTTAYGRKVFGTTPEVARSSAALAANQGLYNGFLAADLLFPTGCATAARS
jgi:putative membrane protein